MAERESLKHEGSEDNKIIAMLAPLVGKLGHASALDPSVLAKATQEQLVPHADLLADVLNSFFFLGFATQV